jgi:predicted transcriptional regulator of viral defense system
MRIDEALGQIKKAGQPVLRTADVMALLNIKKDHASHILSRLASSGHLASLKKGVWLVDPQYDTFAVAGYLTAPFPCYISLQSALYHYGFISQIPSVIYCVSPARTCAYDTPMGRFSIHHISDEFFGGYLTSEKTRARIAAPEKAVLDFLYLGSAKTRLFSSLPELDLSEGFSVRKARDIIRNLASERLRTVLTGRLDRFLKTHD